MKRPMRTLLGTGHVVVGLLLLPGWLIVDLDDSWSLVPDQVPDALLLAVDRGVGAWELPGVGVVLMKAAASGCRSQRDEQLAAVTCVFTGHRVYRRQQCTRPWRKVTEMTDRCADHIENTVLRFGALLHNGSAQTYP